MFITVCIFLCLSLPVAAETLQPRYNDSHLVYLNVTFSSTKASCTGKITGANGTEKITDCTVTLTDSKGNEIGSWENLSSLGSTLIFSKTAYGVEKGKTYTITITADVHRNGSVETLSDFKEFTYS